MISLAVAILSTLVYAAAALRSRGSARSVGAPIVVLGGSAACAAAGGVGDSSAGVSVAEVIVAPLALVLLFVLARAAMTGHRLGTAAMAGLIAILGGAGLIDRIDALNAQLLLVLSLGVWWIVNADEERARRASDQPVERDVSAALTAIAGFASGASIAWAVFDGQHSAILLGLVTAHLLVWGLRQRDAASAATGAVIAVGIAIGCANIVRIAGGAMAQPEWGGGDRAEAIALELAGRPYVPGFGAMLPDVMLLILGVLLATLCLDPGAGRARRIALGGMIGGVGLAQAAWMWLATV